MARKILRPYQQQAIDAVFNEPIGSKNIIALAVGLGKTYTASQLYYQLEEKLGRRAKMLFIARQRQLVFQPAQYFDDRTIGMEMGELHSDGEDIIFATAQSLHRRLSKFDPKEFDLVVADECFTGDVEILTEKGFVRFDELGDERIWQVEDNWKSSLVIPSRKVKKHYQGQAVTFNDITLTPNHNQVLYKDKKWVDCKAKDADPKYVLGVCMNRRIEKSFRTINEPVYCVTVPSGKIFVRKGDTIIISGNCHEAQGKQYKDIVNYFTPAYTLGLTGTPFRLDGKKLTDGLFDKIVFQRNIKWGIENGYLCDVEAVRAYIGYDLSNVKTSGGDYNIVDLEQAMVGTEQAIADAYNQYSQGRPTLIFATGVAHAFAIAELIEGAEVIVGDTKQTERDRIFNSFQNGKCPCIVSVQVMTQGVDLPISTVGIFAKPTKSVGRYQQQVGRILRTHPNKEKALIVDCIGSSNLGLCTAPSLIGINIDKVPEKKQSELEGDLMEMSDLVEILSDVPMSWIRNTKVVDLWAKENKYKTDGVNYFQMPDGRMVVSLPERAKIVLPPPDMLGKVEASEIKGLSQDLLQWGIQEYGKVWDYQRALKAVRAMLERNYADSSMLWDLKKTRSWANKEPTDKQMKIIERKLKDETPENLTRFEASQILNRIRNK